MKRSRAFIAVLSILVLLTAPPVGAQHEGPTATPTMTPVLRSLQVRVAYDAFIRSAPTRSQGNDLGVVRKGTEVEVYGIVADRSPALGGYWYQVRAPGEAGTTVDGWMHSTVVHLAPEQISALPDATQREPGMTLSPVLSPVTPTTAGAEQPTAGGAQPTGKERAGTPPATPIALPTAPPTPTPVGGVLVDVPLALRVCYDLHANKSCDVDEGIRGVLVYAADPQTGEILDEVATDATGLARLVWRVPQDAQRSAAATLSVPYFQQVRTVRAGDPRAAPVIVSTLAPLPAWLP
jgi:hypothetical protein